MNGLTVVAYQTSKSIAREHVEEIENNANFVLSLPETNSYNTDNIINNDQGAATPIFEPGHSPIETTSVLGSETNPAASSIDLQGVDQVRSRLRQTAHAKLAKQFLFDNNYEGFRIFMILTRHSVAEVHSPGPTIEPRLSEAVTLFVHRSIKLATQEFYEGKLEQCLLLLTNMSEYFLDNDDFQRCDILLEICRNYVKQYEEPWNCPFKEKIKECFADVKTFFSEKYKTTNEDEKRPLDCEPKTLIYKTQGLSYEKQNRLSSAIEQYETGLNFTATLLPLKIKISGLLHHLYLASADVTEEPEEKVAICRKALECARTTRNPHNEGSASYALGQALILLERFDEARQLHEEFYELAKAQEDPALQASAMQAIALTYKLTGRLDEAIAENEKILNFSKAPLESQVEAAHELACLYRKVDKPERVTEMLQHQHTLARQLNKEDVLTETKALRGIQKAEDRFEEYKSVLLEKNVGSLLKWHRQHLQ